MPKVIHVITGPLASGKSTYLRKLVEELGMLCSQEMQMGVDAAESEWWKELVDYASVYDTNVVETHIDYRGKDIADLSTNPEIVIGDIEVPPEYVQFRVMLPSVEELTRRYGIRDSEYASDEISRLELEWYRQIGEKINAQVVSE